jgi:NitT/TauT family transport system substrate-binding protein
MKTTYRGALWALLVWGIGLTNVSAKLPELRIAGPVSMTSHPLLYLKESGAWDDVAENMTFQFWKTPEQLRALVIRGEVDIAAMPSNVAAQLHNKGVNVRLVMSAVSGMLWVVSSEAKHQRFASMRQTDFALPFRGNMPEALFVTLLEREKLVKADLRLRYTPGLLDAAQLVIAQQTTHALLAEPTASLALRKNPALHRNFSLHQRWEVEFPQAPSMPQAVVAVVHPRPELAAVLAQLPQQYADVVHLGRTSPAAVIPLVRRALPQLEAAVLQEAWQHTRWQPLPASEAQAHLEPFYQRLLEVEPRLLGGKLPADSFYQPQ